MATSNDSWHCHEAMTEGDDNERWAMTVSSDMVSLSGNTRGVKVVSEVQYVNVNGIDNDNHNTKSMNMDRIG